MQLDNYVHGVDTVFSVRGLTKKEYFIRKPIFWVICKTSEFQSELLILEKLLVCTKT